MVAPTPSVIGLSKMPSGLDPCANRPYTSASPRTALHSVPVPSPSCRDRLRRRCASYPARGSVSKVEMATPMALICKVLFPTISTFETPPARHRASGRDAVARHRARDRANHVQGTLPCRTCLPHSVSSVWYPTRYADADGRPRRYRP